MVQQVILNGVVHDLDYEPSVQHGAKPMWRTPIEINGQMIHGVNINGYDYPPCPSGSILYFPGLPGYGSTIWDRSSGGNNGTISGAGWRRLPSGLWWLYYDGDDIVTVADSASFNITQYLSVITWVQIPDITRNVDSVFAAKYLTTGNKREWGFTRVGTTGTFRCQFGDPVDGTYEGKQTTDAAWIVNNIPICLAMTFAVGTCILYANGVARASTASNVPASLYNSTADVTIGNDLGANSLIGYQGLTVIVGGSAVLTASQNLNFYNQTRHLLGV